MSIDVPASAGYLKCVRGFVKPLFDARFDEEIAHRLVLAVDEACSNIVKHGQTWFSPRGRIALELIDRKKAVEIRILNFCGENEVDKIKPRDLEDIKPGGLGTHFIAEIMDSVEFVPDKTREGRMQLVMIKEGGSK
ncbi:MAG: ATP-binding protein [Planctomycetota bacterium]